MRNGKGLLIVPGRNRRDRHWSLLRAFRPSAAAWGLAAVVCAAPWSYADEPETPGENEQTSPHPPIEAFTRNQIAATFRRDFNRFEITPAVLRDLTEGLGLSEAQEQAAERFHTAYAEALDERWLDLADRIREPLIELAMGIGRGGNGEEALERFGRARAANLLEHMTREMRRARRDSDRLRMQFNEQVKTILAEPQLEAWPGTIRDIRRERLLRPLNPRGSAHIDLAVMPDVIELFEQAVFRMRNLNRCMTLRTPMMTNWPRRTRASASCSPTMSNNWMCF